MQEIVFKSTWNSQLGSMSYVLGAAGVALASGAHVVRSGEYYPWYYRLFGIGKPEYPISGKADSDYVEVEKVFRSHFEQGREVGSSVCVYSRGRKAVELYGGYADYEKGTLFSKDTLQLVFSTSKVLEAIALARLVEKGQLRYSDTIQSIWPEFGEGKKGEVTLEDLMRHEGGVSYIKDPMPTSAEIVDRERLASILAKQEHLHGGEKVRAYHAMTRGWILNEVVFRVAGKTLGQIYQEDFSCFSDVEFSLGLSSENEARRSKWYSYPVFDMLLLLKAPGLAGVRKEGELSKEAFQEGSPLYNTIKFLSVFGKDFENSLAMTSFEIPSSNGFTNARSLAKIGAILASGGTLNGQELVSRETLDAALSEGITAFDTCVYNETTMTKGGFGVFTLEEVGMDTKFYGWTGMGGSVLLFNLDYEFSFSYIMNAQHISILISGRARNLLIAAFRAHLAQNFNANPA